MIAAIAQINCFVGDIQGNAKKIIASAILAKKLGATLLVTPELSLCGYPPEDLLLRSDFLHACNIALTELSLSLADIEPNISVIVGHPHQVGEACYNAASVLQGGNIVATYHKHALPNHSVFDEKRYFTSGEEALVFTHEGIKIGLLIDRKSVV